jgi:hypothetical protein
MTRSSHPTKRSFPFVLAFALVSIVFSAFAASPVHAQRGMGGAHFGGGAHFSAGHFGGGHAGPSHAPAGSHLVRGFHGRIPRYARTSPHLTYVPRYGAGWPLRGNSSRPYWHNRARFQNSAPPFTSPFSYFGNGFFPYGPGFWGWGGWWWGDGGDDGDSTWGPECDWESNCDNGPGYSQDYPPSGGDAEYEQPDVSRPLILVYLRDGTGFGALDYWLSNGILHIETTYGTEKSFPLADVDVQRTFTENTARGVTFTLSPYPLASDPGPMFAPDSYAPECVAPSQPPPPTSSASAPAAATAESGSWFGASGTASDRGLFVTSVRSDSPAAQIGVRPGDIVVRVNCQRIRTAQDVESAVNNAIGPIWVSFMIRGAWLTDKKIVR